MSCTKGDKPTITYTFGSGTNKVYQSNFAPVDITTNSAPIDTGSNYNPVGYQINFASPQAGAGGITLIVVDYQINTYFFSAFDSDNGSYLSFIPCKSSYYALINPCSDSQRKTQQCRQNVIKMTSPSVTVNPLIKCPSPNINRCAIQILSEGQLLFQDQGDCPVNYSVQCGKCPPGTCECASSVYPGYCCLDCDSISSKINQIISQVKQLN